MQSVGAVPVGEESHRHSYLAQFMAAPQSVSAAVIANAVNTPDQPFIWVSNPGLAGWLPGRARIPVTWRTYGLLVATATLALREPKSRNGAGIKPGDRVCLLAENSLQWAVLNRAIQSIGAISVPIHHNYRAPDVAVIINGVEPALVLCDSSETFHKKIDRKLIHWCNHKFMLFSQIFENAMHPGPDFISAGRSGQRAEAHPVVLEEFERLKRQEHDPDEPCLGISTSGSTGKPKCALHTHKSLAAGAAMVMDHGFGFTPDDMVVHYLPLSHIFALGNSGLALCERYSLQCAIVPGKQLRTALVVHRPTILAGVPAAWELMLAGLRKYKIVAWALAKAMAAPQSLPWTAKTILWLAKRKAGLNRIRFGICGGASPDPEVIRAFLGLGIVIYPGYGSSEAQPVFCNNPRRCDFRSLGSALPGVSYRLKAPPAEFGFADSAGVLMVKGLQNFVGYFRDPEKTAESFDADGYFDTGDLVRQEADGTLFFLGRVKGGKKLKNGQFYCEEDIQQIFLDTQKELGFGTLFDPLVVGEDRAYITLLLRVKPDQAALLFGGDPGKQDACAYYAAHAGVLEASNNVLDAVNARIVRFNKMLKIQGSFIMPESPTFENGLLGPTAKLSLIGALKRFSEQVSKLYENA